MKRMRRKLARFGKHSVALQRQIAVVLFCEMLSEFWVVTHALARESLKWAPVRRMDPDDFIASFVAGMGRIYWSHP